MNLSDLEGSEAGNTVVIVGNSPYVKSVELSELNRFRTIGVNAATLLTKLKGLRLDYHVMTDTRFLVEKKEMILGHLSPDTTCFWADNVQGAEKLLPDQEIYYISEIRQEGFSKRLPLGFYSGSTAAHTACQVAYFLKPKRIYLIGIDLTYGVNNTRFYQEKRGQDVDLHIRGRQIVALLKSYEACKEAGIEMKVISKESLLRSRIPSVDFETAVGSRS